MDASSGGKKNGLLTRSSYTNDLSTRANVSSVVSSAHGGVNIRSETGTSHRREPCLRQQSRQPARRLRRPRQCHQRLEGLVNVVSVQDTLDQSFAQKKSGIGLFFGKCGVDVYQKTSKAGTTSIGTNVAASISSKTGDVNVKATRDVNVKGSVVTAKGYLTVEAKRDERHAWHQCGGPDLHQRGLGRRLSCFGE
jgi:hypothetical protein